MSGLGGLIYVSKYMATISKAFSLMSRAEDGRDGPWRCIDGTVNKSAISLEAVAMRYCWFLGNTGHLKSLIISHLHYTLCCLCVCVCVRSVVSVSILVCARLGLNRNRSGWKTHSRRWFKCHDLCSLDI